MKLLLALLLTAALSACATVTNPKTGAVTVQPIQIAQTKLAVATHADLQNAAKIATNAANATTDPALKAALLARAAKWTALDTLLTTQQGQIQACLNAIAAMKPKLPAGAGIPAPHVFSDLEIAAEALGNFQGLTPAVKLACAAIPVPPLPLLPTPK